MKSKCSALQMIKVIRRQFAGDDEIVLPEQKLILAIISSAIVNLRDKHFARIARDFFKGEMFRIYCDLIGIDPAATLRLLVEAGFLEGA